MHWTEVWIRQNRCSFIMALFGVLLAVWMPVHAQYVEAREYESRSSRFIAAGAVQRDFHSRSSNTLPDSLAIGFARLMPLISFHQGTVDIAFGYAQYSHRGATRSTLFVGSTVVNEFPLAASPSSALLLPVALSLDFTKAETAGSERDHFNIACIGLGAGLAYRALGSSVDFSLSLLEVAQFGFEGLSTGSGFSAATLGEATAGLKRVGIFDGVVIGYRLRYQTWSMSDRRFNYRSFFHGPFVGVMF